MRRISEKEAGTFWQKKTPWEGSQGVGLRADWSVGVGPKVAFNISKAFCGQFTQSLSNLKNSLFKT
ncbi:MAG: hypothetical protein CL676_06665 [Bdellovibrionaceae bacterium]|nr:hypothetical protein [Pseudobdellovibrionaceae bacterium]